MTREELDTLWQKALYESVVAGEYFIRYHFAAMVAAAEREACAEIAEKEMRNTTVLTSNPPKSAAAWNIRNAIRERSEV